MTNYAQLLDVPQFRLGETWHDPPVNKPTALLFYLACRGEWVSRDELLYVFYTDAAEKPARTNLRQLLTLTRRLPYSEGLETQDTRLRWPIETDVASFKKAVAEEKWSKALELYKGELLHGFQPHDLSEFDNWLSLERQTLQAAWRKASLTFATELAGSERYSAAVEVLAPMHKADSLDEEVMRAYLENLYGSGQKGEALDTFATFRKTLYHDLSSEPEGATLTLLEHIKRDEPLRKTSQVAVKTYTAEHVVEVGLRHNLPTQPTQFVGRDLEKAKLTELLTDPTCHLVTIVAPGGMGKTRLAIETAHARVANVERVCFVSFAAVASPELMIYTLADALELSLFGPRPPTDQILEYLKNKKMLLVLDNLEHLLSGIDLISEILATAPDIKILATSRERLGLQSEHLFDLNGLAVPEANGPDAHSFDALRLFAERAKHNRLDFVLGENLQAVTRICQLVGGMPLAIELAASWSRLLSPSEIAAELEGSLDILSTSARDLPERHHSMRMVFEVSWQRLSEEEQAALRKLSVFQGGFTREAARAITQIDLRTLFTLVNKSFLWRNVSGRFSQHPLLYHYSQQKFAEHPKERSDTQDKHVNYYAGLMMHRWREEFGPQNKEIIDATEVELGNVRAAWPHLLSNQKVEQIDQVTRGLWRYYRYRGSAQAAIDMLTQAVPVLEGKPGHAREVLVSMLTVLARFYLLLGKLAQAKALAEQGLALRHTLDSPIENDSKLLGTLGSITATLGDYAEARRYCEESLAEVRATNNRIQEAIELHNLAQTILCLGDYAQAEKLHLEGIAIDRELGNLEGISSDLAGLGEVYLAMKEWKKAETAFRESLEIARTIDFRHSIPVALHGLGELAFARGEPIKAQANFEEALGVLVQNPDAELSTRLFSNLARVAICTGNFASSESYLKQALNTAQLSGAVPELLYGLTVFAELSIANGSLKQGVTLLSLLSGYPAMKKRDRDEVLKLLETARPHLSAQDFTQAQEEGKALTLGEIVTGILGEEARAR